jgi:DNA replication protein DnaC
MELVNLLEKLKMEHLEAQLDAVCEQSAQRGEDFKTFLTKALSTEWQGRYQRGIEARLRQARFPWIKTWISSTSTFSHHSTTARCGSSPS